MKFHDAPDQRQTDARAFGARVQLVEQAEDGLVIAGFNALAVVADKENRLVAGSWKPISISGSAPGRET